MAASTFQPELELAKSAALAAGGVLHGDGTQLAVVRSKSLPTDIVTGADLAADRLIVDCIQHAFPDDYVLSEESDDEEFVPANGRRWIVDPLDGTANYLRGLWPSVISIALEVHDVLSVGVVYDYINDDMYCATLGAGSWLNDQMLWRNDAVADLSEAFVGLSGSNATGEIENRVEVMKKLALASDSVRDMGSTAMQLCLVARGSLDAHVVMDVNLWDVAAGFVIAHEAGCSVRGFELVDAPTPARAVAAAPGLEIELAQLLNK